MASCDFKKILVIQVSRIGDTLFATPAIRAIAENCPHAEITVLAHPNRSSVFEYLPFIYQVGSIEKKRATFMGWLGTKKFDLAFVYGFDQELVKYALRVSKKVIAFRQKNEALNLKLHQIVEPPAFQSEHAVKQLLRLPEVLGWTTNNLRLAMQMTLAEFTQAHNYLERLNIEKKATFIIGLQVASFPTKSYRDWPIESFAELAKLIKTKIPNAHFLIYGGKAEINKTRWLHNQLADYATHLAGELSLRETAAFMGLSHLYIGIDTGPTHIMSTFDVPMIVLFHCLSTSAMTGALQHPAYIGLDLVADNRPCNEEILLSEISVQSVLDSSLQLIQKYYPIVIK